MPPTLPELLSPAGDMAALRAAVDCGANAVYLGYKAFGARASAVNFDAGALAQAVEYAHLYHVRVHVTVNTLVKEREIPDVLDALTQIQAAGADAVIVQDMGVAALVRFRFPGLELHASTQMAVCNASGALEARALGFQRVVLARECGLDDVRRVVATGVETEVFAHGALCTAVSGRCLMSSMSGGRSGNRGRCAQPCRQCFRLSDEWSGPLLSLRDLCLLDDLPALCDAGVASFKLEGRLKSAEYVAVVTSVYRKALDNLAQGHFHVTAGDKRQLLQIYNRGGFTRGHALGAEDAALVTPGRVSHDGIPVGRVLSLKRGMAVLKIDIALNDGDTLQLRAKDKAYDLRYSGPDVAAGDTALLRLRPDIRIQPGMAVSRLSDARQLEAARSHEPAPIPVAMVARVQLGRPSALSISDGATAITVEAAAPQPAQSRVLTPGDVRKQLEKLGGTPYAVKAANGKPCIQVAMDENAFLPVSVLNTLRRDAVSQLTQARIRAFESCKKASLPPVQAPPRRPAFQRLGAQTLAVIFSAPEAASMLYDAGATLLCYAPRVFTPQALDSALRQMPPGVWLRLPPQMTQSALDAVLPVVSKHCARLGGILAESVAQLGLELPLPILAGEGIPATNREGVRSLAQQGVCGLTLWPEWTFQEQLDLLPLELPALLKVYGYETLMLLNHCPERVRLGLTQDRAHCALCAGDHMVCGRESASLTDRKGYRFPLMRTRFPEGCEISVLGALPTDLRAFEADRRRLGAGMLLRFTTEPLDEQITLTRLYAALLLGAAIPAAHFPSTSGHWLRGVE